MGKDSECHLQIKLIPRQSGADSHPPIIIYGLPVMRCPSVQYESFYVFFLARIEKLLFVFTILFLSLPKLDISSSIVSPSLSHTGENDSPFALASNAPVPLSSR